MRGRQLVKLFEANPADGGGPAAGFKFLLEHCENAFAIAMAALDQLPSLHFKQLLVMFHVTDIPTIYLAASCPVLRPSP